eukprot:TRINITY_DN4186_c0_g2_i2.p1 TRINITY_DN4186_c0_g2~~TRINITY_DN4186_c0_g2_i2.p1  ORF type:complete len:617 (+),score=132.97 TRINITY_DN4186_c0_g2_i2:187-2037(+)
MSSILASSRIGAGHKAMQGLTERVAFLHHRAFSKTIPTLSTFETWRFPMKYQDRTDLLLDGFPSLVRSKGPLVELPTNILGDAFGHDLTSLQLVADPDVAGQLLSSHRPAHVHNLPPNQGFKHPFKNSYSQASPRTFEKERRIVENTVEAVGGMFAFAGTTRASLEMIRALEKERHQLEAPSDAIDVGPYFDNLTEDILARTLFGVQWEDKEEASVVTNVCDLLTPGDLSSRFLPNDIGTAIPFAIYNQWSNDLITKRYASVMNKAGQQGGKGGARSVLDALISTYAALGVPKDIARSIVSDNVIMLFHNARRPLQSLFRSLTNLLALYPEHQQEVYKDIYSAIGSELPGSLQDVRGMRWLEALIKEVMRHHGPYPLLPALHTSQDLAIEGYNFKKGTAFLIASGIIHGRPDIWDRYCSAFDPSRFYSAQPEIEKALGAFTPFSVGSRKCPGERLSFDILLTATTIFLQHYRPLTFKGTNPALPKLEMAKGTQEWAVMPSRAPVTLDLRALEDWRDTIKKEAQSSISDGTGNSSSSSGSRRDSSSSGSGSSSIAPAATSTTASPTRRDDVLCLAPHHSSHPHTVRRPSQRRDTMRSTCPSRGTASGVMTTRAVVMC